MKKIILFLSAIYMMITSCTKLERNNPLDVVNVKSSSIGLLDSTTINGKKYYTIQATAGTNGTIVPFGIQTVDSGSDKTFCIKPNNGYIIDRILIDNFDSTNRLYEVSGEYYYKFTNISGIHTIKSTFKIENKGLSLSLDKYVAKNLYPDEDVTLKLYIKNVSSTPLDNTVVYISSNSNYIDRTFIILPEILDNFSGIVFYKSFFDGKILSSDVTYIGDIRFHIKDAYKDVEIDFNIKLSGSQGECNIPFTYFWK